MTDRELLELAAKAMGRGDLVWCSALNGMVRNSRPDKQLHLDDVASHWNPLTNDGDALRLAVKLRLDLCRPTKMHDGVCVWVDHLGDFIEEPLGSDHYAATRRAIVRAAAEIGKGMKS